jgi:hypothetical protein
MVSEAKTLIASECPRNDLKKLSDGFGIPFFTVIQDFETFFNKFLGGCVARPAVVRPVGERSTS